MMQASGWKRLGVVVALLACVAVAAVAIANLWESSGETVSLRGVHPAWAALATGSMLAGVLTYAVAWWLLMNALERRPVAFRSTVQLFLLSWPGRYVPGSVPHYGGRLLAGPRLGLTRPAVAASLAYENLLSIAASGLIAVALLLVTLHGRIGGGAWAFAALAGTVLAAGCLHPAVVRACIRLAARRVRRLQVLEDHVLSLPSVVRIGAVYAIGAMLAGLSYYFALRAVAPGGGAPLMLCIAAYNLAGIAGMLAIAVPSGIGVREGVVVALVSAAVSPPIALAAAIAVRLAAVISDLVPAAVIISFAALPRLRRFGPSNRSPVPVADVRPEEPTARAA